MFAQVNAAMAESTIEVLVWLYTILVVFIPFTMILAFWQLVAAIVGWRTEFRNRRLCRSGALAATSLLIPVLLAGLWRGVIRPAMGSQLLASVNAERAEKLASTSFVQIGDTAPTFHSVTLDGTPFSMSSEGDVILINFFATSCGPCLVELPHIEKIWLDNKQNPDFKLLAIGREESSDALLRFREKRGFTFPICADPDSTIFSLFANESIPRTLIVASDGRIVYSQIGFVEEDLSELKSVLAAQLETNRLKTSPKSVLK
jgi:peroxiredoxin